MKTLKSMNPPLSFEEAQAALADFHAPAIVVDKEAETQVRELQQVIETLRAQRDGVLFEAQARIFMNCPYTPERQQVLAILKEMQA